MEALTYFHIIGRAVFFICCKFRIEHVITRSCFDMYSLQWYMQSSTAEYKGSLDGHFPQVNMNL